MFKAIMIATFLMVVMGTTTVSAEDVRQQPVYDITSDGLWDLLRKCSYKWRCQPY